MGAVADLVTKHFGIADGELLVGGLTVRSIVEQYGTPLFIYDASVMEKQWNRLRQALPHRFSIYYSVKANPNRAILQYFLSKGSGLEIASAGEFEQAVRAGCRPDQIIFAGPGKSEAELELVLRQQIGEIHVESSREVARVGSISRRLGVKAHVALRVNPSGEAQGGAMRMGGKPAAFGVDEEQCESVIDQILSEQAIEFRGIHLFAGTQILDHEILLAQYRKGVEIARRVATRYGHPVQTLDFGGGLGIPYFSHEIALDLEKLKAALTEFQASLENDPLLAGTRFIVELGRFLVGEAGLYVASVNDVKSSRGKTFVVLDGGMNHHLAASGNLGQVIKRNFPIALANKIDQANRQVVDIVGPLCTPLDTLAKELSIPAVDVGDLVAVFQSGAYARSASPLGFLSHCTPAEVLVKGGMASLVRRRGTHEDLMSDQL